MPRSNAECLWTGVWVKVAQTSDRRIERIARRVSRMGTVRRAWNWTLSRFFRRVADAQRHFGNLYGNREEHWAAVGNYTRAGVLDPTYAEVYYSRGVLYWRELGEYERAIQDLTRALELDATRAETYFNRGMAYSLSHQVDKALVDFERYLEQGSDEFWLDAARRQLAALRENAASPVQTEQEADL